MWYRICWRSPVNGEVQRGRPLFKSGELAEEVARMMDDLWTGTRHWVEPADAPVAVRHPKVLLELR
jgi:hypothetical protein